MLLARVNGWQSGILRFILMDSSSSSGGALVGLLSSTSGLIISTIADVEATPTVYTSAASHVDTVATLGTYAAPTSGHCNFKQVDSTNHPGLYELQLANTRFSITNASYLIVTVQAPGANCSPQSFLIDLDAQVDVVEFGGEPGTFNITGVPAVDVQAVDASASAANVLALELNARVVGTVAASPAPTTTVFECDDITDSATFPVYINKGYVITSGTVIRGVGVVLTDQVGTGGRRFTVMAQQHVCAAGDKILFF